MEDLYPENLRPALGLTQATGGVNLDINYQGETEVDQNRILGFGMNEDDEFYDSDEEIMREMELSQRKERDHVEEKHLESEYMQRDEHDVEDAHRPSGDGYTAQFVESAQAEFLSSQGSASKAATGPPESDEVQRPQLDVSDSTYVPSPFNDPEVRGSCRI